MQLHTCGGPRLEHTRHCIASMHPPRGPAGRRLLHKIDGGLQRHNTLLSSSLSVVQHGETHASACAACPNPWRGSLADLLSTLATHKVKIKGPRQAPRAIEWPKRALHPSPALSIVPLVPTKWCVRRREPCHGPCVIAMSMSCARS